MKYPFLFCALFLLSLAPVLAFAQEHRRDSVYFTMDDGIMSPEEMEMEAQDIHAVCANDIAFRSLYNCDCLAGAFLQERERLGPMVPQSTIYNDITLNNPADCANTEMVAGNNYMICMQQMAPLRFGATDNEEYCSCVGNDVANNFAKAPALAPTYVRALLGDAYQYCDDPQNRPRPRSASRNVN